MRKPAGYQIQYQASRTSGRFDIYSQCVLLGDEAVSVWLRPGVRGSRRVRPPPHQAGHCQVFSPSLSLKDNVDN